MESIFITDQWSYLQEKKEGGKFVKYIFESENGKITHPFIKREAGVIEDVQYYDIATVRGFAGPRIEMFSEGNITVLVNEFIEEFSQYCINNNIVAEFVRFDPWHVQHEYFKHFYNIHEAGTVYGYSLLSDFFMEEYSSDRRREIRKAMKKSVRIEFDHTGKTIDKFLEQYQFSINKYNVDSYYIFDNEFFEKYFELLPNQVFIVNAIYDKQVISSSIVLLGKDIAHLHLSGTNPDYRSYEGNSLIIYEASLYAAKLGKKIFDIGAAREGNAIEFFKKSFAGKTPNYPFYKGSRVYQNEIYNQLVDQSGGPRIGFFPAYRKV